MRFLHCLFFLFLIQFSFSQPVKYTVANAHSHNDYEKTVPFWAAYKAGFGSIEADVFLHGNELLVAHEEKDLINRRRLEDLYLKPLEECIKKHGNFVYSDTSKQLQLLIDIKTDSIATLNKLISVLQNHPALINNPTLKLVITGNRPPPDSFTSYPSYLFFDGNIGTIYSNASLGKIAMLSSSFRNYSKWNGTGRLPITEKNLLAKEIEKAHMLQKPVRFWAAPDVKNAWRQFMVLRVDFINTDQISAIATFLNK